MAIQKYSPDASTLKTMSDTGHILADISKYSIRARSMLCALGDYWTDYYSQLEPLASATTGSVAALSKVYTRLLDLVRTSNILTIPISQSTQFELLVINQNDVQIIYDAQGTIEAYFVPCADIVDTRYLTTTLFESPVVLERDVHFKIEQGHGYTFFVDLFNDPGIIGYAYATSEENNRHLLLWACDIAFSSTIIYERYGHFLYHKAIDSEQYKWLITALMRFYENTKSVQCIQHVLNVMYGVPYTRFKDEVVKDIYYVDATLKKCTKLIEDPYICIETDKNKYYTYAFSKILYKIGDVIPQFSLLADFNKVEDYVSNPGWWEHVPFPTTLAEGADGLTSAEQHELMDKVLKYNTVHISIGVSFETYETYLNQVKEFFSIIESGFPVYLYPLVDTFFKAVFLDEFADIHDVFAQLHLRVQNVSLYPWGNRHLFDGSISYTGRKEVQSNPHNVVFDGYTDYNPAITRHNHTGFATDIDIFDGLACYLDDKTILHNNEIEYFTLNKINFKEWSEIFPWESSPHARKRSSMQYDGHKNADGVYVFDGEGYVVENEDLLLQVALLPLADNLPVEVSVTFATTLQIEDNLGAKTYNGELAYDALVELQCNVFIDKTQFALTVQGWQEKFPWTTSPHAKRSSLVYDGSDVANGTRFFNGDRIDNEDWQVLATLASISDYEQIEYVVQLQTHNIIQERIAPVYDGAYTYQTLAKLPLKTFYDEYGLSLHLRGWLEQTAIATQHFSASAQARISDQARTSDVAPLTIQMTTKEPALPLYDGSFAYGELAPALQQAVSERIALQMQYAWRDNLSEQTSPNAHLCYVQYAGEQKADGTYFFDGQVYTSEKENVQTVASLALDDQLQSQAVFAISTHPHDVDAMHATYDGSCTYGDLPRILQKPCIETEQTTANLSGWTEHYPFAEQDDNEDLLLLIHTRPISDTIFLKESALPLQFHLQETEFVGDTVFTGQHSYNGACTFTPQHLTEHFVVNISPKP